MKGAETIGRRGAKRPGEATRQLWSRSATQQRGTSWAVVKTKWRGDPGGSKLVKGFKNNERAAAVKKDGMVSLGVGIDRQWNFWVQEPPEVRSLKFAARGETTCWKDWQCP